MAASADPVVGDRTLYLPAADALVLADLHLGREAVSELTIPVGERRDLRERFERALARFDPATVVLAGDVLHAHGTVPTGVDDTLGDLEDAAARAGATLDLVRGNHDGMLESLRPGDVVDHRRLADGTVVCHGHEEPPVDADRYVFGHDHPTIVIEGRRHPCALVGRYGDAEAIALPAFTRLAAGVPVNDARAGDRQSPLLADLESFRPVVYDADAEESLAFPPLGALRSLL